VPADELSLGNGLFLGLNLRVTATAGWATGARSSPPLLDMTKTAQSEPDPYWEDVRHEDGDRNHLTPRNFYLLMSHEAVCIPPSLAAENDGVRPTSGELRTHYGRLLRPRLRL